MNKLKNLVIILIASIIIIMQFSIVNAVAKNNNPMLKEIKINGKDIEPQFEMFTTEYVLTIDEEIEKINVEAIPDDEKASVEIKGDTNLKLGRNEIEIQVTAEDGRAKQSYFLYITKGDSINTNANLKVLKIKDCELAPTFEKNTINYAFEYPEYLKKVEIEAIPEDNDAKVEIIGNENLKEIVQNIEIKVTAKDGQTIKKYYLIAKKLGMTVESQTGEEEQTEENGPRIEIIGETEEVEKEEKSSIMIYILLGILVFIIIVMTIKIVIERRKNKK